MKYVVNWIPLRIRVRSRNTQPQLKQIVWFILKCNLSSMDRQTTLSPECRWFDTWLEHSQNVCILHIVIVCLSRKTNNFCKNYQENFHYCRCGCPAGFEVLSMGLSSLLQRPLGYSATATNIVFLRSNNYLYLYFHFVERSRRFLFFSEVDMKRYDRFLKFGAKTFEPINFCQLWSHTTGTHNRWQNTCPKLVKLYHRQRDRLLGESWWPKKRGATGIAQKSRNSWRFSCVGVGA